MNELIAASDANVLPAVRVQEQFETAITGLALLKPIGELALNGAAADVQDEVAWVGKLIEGGYQQYLDPRVEIPPADQYALLEGTWSVLGYNVPELSAKQQDHLYDVARANPTWRIIMTPLLDTFARQELTERARDILPNSFNPNEPVLRLPDDGTLIRSLTVAGNLEGNLEWADEEHGIPSGNYGIRYKTSEDRLLSRPEYLDDLVRRGEAVRSDDGTTWTFLVMDTQPYAQEVPLLQPSSDEVAVPDQPTSRNAGDFYASTDLPPTEALIFANILHHGAGAPNLGYAIDYSNEAIYKLVDGQAVGNAAFITTIRNRSQDKVYDKDDSKIVISDTSRIGWYARQQGSIRSYAGARPFVNGLK